MSVTEPTSIEELRIAREGLGLPADGPDRPASANGRPLSERAGDEPEEPEELPRLPHEEDEDNYPIGALFGDPDLTFARLKKSGRPVQVTASLTAAEVPIRDGKLLDPDKSGQVLVTVVPQKAELIYQREGLKDGDYTVTGYKIRQPLKTAYVQTADDMYTGDQVTDLIKKALFQVGITDSDKTDEILEDLLSVEAD